MSQTRVGVLVLPTPKNSKTGIASDPRGIAIYEKLTKNKLVLSNYAFKNVDAFYAFKDHIDEIEALNARIDRKHFIEDPMPEWVNQKDPVSYYGAMMLEMCRRVDQLLIMSPGPKVPYVMALAASTRLANGIAGIRMIIGERMLGPEEIMAGIRSQDKAELKALFSRVTPPANNVSAPVTTPTSQSGLKLLQTPSGATLRPYQQQMVDFVREKKRVGLFVDMGLGKTLATLAAIDDLVNKGEIDYTRPILIVAPIMVALDTWSREADKWGYDMDVKINIHLSKKKREALLETLIKPQEKITLVTTNPAQLPAILEFFNARQIPDPFQVIVVDELSQFKSPTSQRVENLSKIAKFADYFLGLTGTPAPNNLLDVYSQLMSIDPKNGKRFGYNFYEYRSRFFEPDIIGRDNTIYSYKLQQGAEKEIYELMKPTVISMRSTGLIDLPKIQYSKLVVNMPKKAMKFYREMDTEIRKKIKDAEDSDEDVMVTIGDSELPVANSAVLTGKLAQLSSGAIYDDWLDVSPEELSQSKAKDRHYTIYHDEKMKALKDLVDNATSPILVFFYFKSELERMEDYFEFTYLDPHRKDLKQVISDWNNGKIPVLVAHPASAGHGLNLQDGGHTMVWLTTTWSNEQYRQSVKRLYRSGQKNPVSVIHIVAAGTVDEEIIDRIDDKEEHQDELMATLDVAKREN